jgi:Protein of unknown function (DUF1569)
MEEFVEDAFAEERHMETLFNPADRAAIVRRLVALQPSSARQWGKMSPAQMLAHCATMMEDACGDAVRKQSLLGTILAPFAKPRVLGDKPMMRNSPTSPAFVVTDERDLARERERLCALIARFGDGGAAAADGRVHVFFGRLTGDQWGRLMYKHLDHHLRQFSA